MAQRASRPPPSKAQSTRSRAAKSVKLAKSTQSAKPAKPAAPPKRNVVPDSVDFRDRPYMPAIAFAPRPSLPPPAASVRPRLNQQSSSACTGFALATAMHVLTARRDRQFGGNVAPFMIYAMGRRYDEFKGEAPDGGSSLRGVLKGWYKHGVCAENFWNSLPEPKPTGKLDWWDDAVRRPLGAYYRVDARSVVDMQVALNETGVLVASGLAHDGWLEGMPGARKPLPAGQKLWRIPYPWKANADDGHAFALVGYDADGFIVQNSWGDPWGTHGLAVLTYEDWIEHGFDCWAAQLGVVTRRHELQATGTTPKTGASFGAPGTIMLDLHEVSPHVINTGRGGELSLAGEFNTSAADLDELVGPRLTAFRTEQGLAAHDRVDVVLYAHGGLVSERDAGKSAKDWIDAFKAAGIFPMFMFWESDFLTILRDRIVNELRNRGQLPAGGPLSFVDDFWSDRVEGIARVAARWAWDDMKIRAEAVSDHAAGGGRLLLDRLTPLRSRIRLHLVGHSAGAVLQARLLFELIRDGWTVESLNLLAPAITVDHYHTDIEPLARAGTVRRAAQFHLTDECENNESGAMRAALLYKRSLLYLISNAFEGARGVPVLGMERFFNRDVAPTLPPNYTVRVAPSSGASGAVRHGDFDDDKKTRAAVIAHMLGQAVPLP